MQHMQRGFLFKYKTQTGDTGFRLQFTHRLIVWTAIKTCCLASLRWYKTFFPSRDGHSACSLSPNQSTLRLRLTVTLDHDWLVLRRKPPSQHHTMTFMTVMRQVRSMDSDSDLTICWLSTNPHPSDWVYICPVQLQVSGGGTWRGRLPSLCHPPQQWAWWCCEWPLSSTHTYGHFRVDS